MMSRLLGVLAAMLALAAAFPLHAAPAAPVNLMVYHIERHGQKVIVKDADEKTLTMIICPHQVLTSLLEPMVAWSVLGPLRVNTNMFLTMTLIRLLIKMGTLSFSAT